MAVIAPSILSADFAHLARDVGRIEDAGARIIHFDVMDGHFVPNLTMGLPVLESLRKITRLHIDVHLMIANPDEMAEAYVNAGADSVSVHIETVRHLDRLLSRIHKKGAQAGTALNPHSPVSLLTDVLPKCDFVLVMSVNPGFPAQKFIPYSLEKVRRLKKMATERGLDVKIEMDGGIDSENVVDAVEAGTDWVVSGSSIFGQDDPAKAFAALQSSADACTVGT